MMTIMLFFPLHGGTSIFVSLSSQKSSNISEHVDSHSHQSSCKVIIDEKRWCSVVGKNDFILDLSSSRLGPVPSCWRICDFWCKYDVLEHFPSANQSHPDMHARLHVAYIGSHLNTRKCQRRNQEWLRDGKQFFRSNLSLRLSFFFSIFFFSPL